MHPKGHSANPTTGELPNRRIVHMAAFQTLLGLGIQQQPSTHQQITQHAA